MSPGKADAGLTGRVSRVSEWIKQTSASTVRRLRPIPFARVAATADDLGEDFGAGLHAAEVRFLIEREWAMTADDVLWRRSKLGLRLGPEDVARLAAFVQRVTAERSRQPTT